MEEILATYAPITLNEMSGIRLMNRTDTKFVTTEDRLADLLELAQPDYRVQLLEADDGARAEYVGRPVLPYSTTYFDTPDYAMFYTHQHGHAGRQKLRIRSYDSSELAFLEVKTKNNRGRTKKKRVPLDAGTPHLWTPGVATTEEAAFVHRHLLAYDPLTLAPKVANRFDRITLVNRALTERLTIDCHLAFRNPVSGCDLELPRIVIIELKRDGLQPSPILGLLRQLRIRPMGFSKYCIGSALTNPQLRINRFKPRLRRIEKMMAMR